MRAIVLVGGAGTRLRPLTHRTPKQLAPVLNRPLLAHLLLHLRAHGIDSITLAMTRTEGNDAIRAVFGDGAALGVRIDYAYEETPLGSGGAIATAAAGWDEPFLVCNGDIISDLDITAMAAEHRRRDAELSISLHKVEDPSPFGVVALDADGRIERFVEKPSRDAAPSRLINAGTWLFQPALLAELDGTRFNRVEDELFPALAAAGRAIVGFHGPGYWSDVGSPEAYLAVNRDLLRGAIPARLPANWPPSAILTAGARIDARATISAPTLIGPESRVGTSARVEGPTVAGAGCTLDRGAAVGGSVLWDGVTIAAGAAVRDSILAGGVTVEAGAVVESAVIAHDVTVERGQRVPPGTRVEPGTRYAEAAHA